MNIQMNTLSRCLALLSCISVLSFAAPLQTARAGGIQIHIGNGTYGYSNGRHGHHYNHHNYKQHYTRNYSGYRAPCYGAHHTRGSAGRYDCYGRNIAQRSYRQRNYGSRSYGSRNYGNHNSYQQRRFGSHSYGNSHHGYSEHHNARQHGRSKYYGRGGNSYYRRY